MIKLQTMFNHKNHADHPVVIPNVGEILPGESKDFDVEYKNPDLDITESGTKPQTTQQPIPSTQPRNIGAGASGANGISNGGDDASVGGTN